MDDLGINLIPEPRRPRNTAGTTTKMESETEPDWLVQILFAVTYYISGLALACGWIVAAAGAKNSNDPSGLLVMLWVTVSAVPSLAFAEAMRVGVRMLCVISQRK